jgi:dipeptidyl aminopeptidase/acylaminoacyl peptidase
VAAHDTTNPTRIGACGASYGAYLAALLSGHRPVKQLLLRAPALAGDIDIRSYRKSYAEESEPETFDSLSVLSRYNGRVLIVESGKDCRIPHSNIVAYFNACRHAEYEVIPEAGHALTDPVWNAAFVQMIIRWFSSL